MALFNELLQRNKAYVPTHKPFPTIEEIEKKGGGPPKTCVVTCVDPRVFPETLLGINWGEVFLFRTIAGRPQSCFNDLVTLDAVSHGFDDLIIMYHTDCGALRFNEDSIRSELSKTDGKDQVPNLWLPTITKSSEESLRSDLEWMKAQPLLRKDLAKCIRGYIYDLKSGEVREVKSA
ncbi:carbonic anhydrase [Myriangium duriaei CBS 260.36]|uniref:Carbonic anhydrase n=1 Tax=Myriangium duriaei CBS 260.36 TaxID=1168546 RepID=A0A9P4MM96_9PEZI|nr:carbonic anhydrase [Myriangium duriaei CBS 260.36]